MDIALALKTGLGILRRRWLLLVLPLLVGAPIAVAVAMLLPPVYVSTARILVESQQIPGDLARSTVSQSAAERIQFIRQRLLTRRNVLEIAQQHGVFADRPETSQGDIVRQMLAAIRIEGTTTTAGRRSNTTMTGVEISFRDDNAETAARVANELVSRVLSQNVQQRTERASGTLAFFNDEVRRLAVEIETLSNRITAFRADNQTSLTASQAELTSLLDARFEREAQRVEMEAQRALLRDALARGATQVDPNGGPTPREREIERLRSTLIAQRAVLAETHPTIRLLQARIAALETLEQEIESADANDEGSATGEAAPSQLEAQIAAIDRRLQILDERSARDDARIAELEVALENAPEAQMTFAGMQREFETLQARYRDAALKQAQAEVGERLEANQQAERFEVVEQAIAPDQPVSPNRPLVMTAGVVLSGGFGVFLMIAAELLNRSIRTPEAMESQLELRPIVTIPRIETLRERRVKLWRIRAALALAIALPLIALFLLDRYYLPLPVLVEQLADRSGVSGFIDMLSQRLGS